MKRLTLDVLNRILSIFDLVLTDVGLFYRHGLRYGNIDYFIINDYDKVLEFLGIPYKPDNSLESLYYAVTNSDYFHSSLYTKYTKGNKRFNEFVAYLKKREPVSFHRPVYIANWGAIKADTFFGTNILRKIVLLGPNLGLTNKSLRNKFNGHLVMKWTGLSPGTYLADTIKEFKIYASEKFDCSFLDYLNSRPIKVIRYDFKVFYFVDSLVGEVPF
jgi:hypothetical protein